MNVASTSSVAHFDAFASILQSFDSSRHRNDGPASDEAASLDDLLDGDQGIALRFASVIEGILESRLSPSSSELSTEDQLSSLSLEHSAWSLLHSLYSDRLLPPAPLPSPESLLAANPYTPPLTLIQRIISSDPELAEWQILHSHLMRPEKGRSTPFGLVERKEGYWALTAGFVRRGKMVGGQNLMGKPRDLVESLDPDAPLRPVGVRGGGVLGAEDANHTLSLLPALFTYLRYGRVEDCAELCRANDQSWRGASLLGGGSGWWIGGLSVKDVDDMDDDEDDFEQEMTEIGNRNRALWKQIGRSVASNSKLPIYERALYGTLIGHLPSVLPVCKSWEDHVWAHVNARIEARIDRKLRDLGGFWADEFGVADPGEGEVDDRGGLADVFAQVLKTERDGVAAAARDPYRMAITHVILGRTDELFNQFAASLPGLRDNISAELYPPLLRFFAHLILYLRLLRQETPIEAANAILQAYLNVLEEEGKSELVAVYAASLGEQNGAESYARFLRAMDPNATKAERRLALVRAKEHGLDLVEVARLTVQLVTAETFMSMPSLDEPEPDVTEFTTTLAEGSPDWVLIRSLEWLTASEETYPDALVQANALIRFFLSSGKVHAAQELLAVLPRQLITAASHGGARDKSQAVEFVHHNLLFDALNLYVRCGEFASTRPKPGLKIDMLEWGKNYAINIEEARAATLSIFTESWLKFPLESESMEDERRQLELDRIRHIFIPELAFRLHHLLFSTRADIPGNLAKALELPNILANEKYQLFVEFTQSRRNRLPAYLALVRETALACLESKTGDGRDPFQA